MKSLEDPISFFEDWLEILRKDFEIKNFKEFRDEMFDFVSDIKNKKDISDIIFIIDKYRNNQ